MLVIAVNRARAAAGVSWKLSETMWQSAQERPFPPRPARVPSWKPALPRQKLESMATCATPVIGSHESDVHSLPSSMVSAGLELQVPAPSQVSAPLQAFPSEQATPAASGVCVTPPAGVQASKVQGLPSSITGREPGAQPPRPLHTSAPLQAFPSEQPATTVPAGTGWCVTWPAESHASFVHTLPSSTTGPGKIT